MSRSRVPALTLLIASAVAAIAPADVRLPAVLTSNMVVQGDADASIWGWADPGEEVTVSADWAAPVTVRADRDGRWRASVRTPAPRAADAFKPHTITVAGKNTIVLDNVLIGEVWICSGQSNMEMFVGDHGGGYRGVVNWRKEAEEATYPAIRFFTVQNAVSTKPEEDCKSVPLVEKSTGWVECSPSSVVNFSAAAYFFGCELHKSLNIPIGLIATDWGGTPAQAWTSEESLAPFEHYTRELHEVRARAQGGGEHPMRAWWDKVEAIDRKAMLKGDSHPRDPAYDDSAWSLARVPGSWEPYLGSFDGLAWYRRTIHIREDWKDKILTLSLGAIDDMDATYFDGMPIGSTIGPDKWFAPRTYSIPARVVAPGAHTIAVRVLDTGGAGGFGGQPDQLFIQPADKSAEPMSLAGYWRYTRSAPLSDLPPLSEAQGPRLTSHTPTALYNAMIAPLTNMAIRGAIWYQGESNRGRAEEYDTLFPAMITSWRRAWGRGDFPFYYVQIAPFRYGGDKGETARLREAQRRTLSLSNTGMAVTMDIGNPDDIHPANKQDVGKRLALWALARTYGKSDIEYSGPLAVEIAPTQSGVNVRFEHARGLTARGGKLESFEVAGDDGQFVPAEATIIGADTIQVSSPRVRDPRAVRYGWCDACAPNLFNAAGLPASPFILTRSKGG